MFGNNSQNKDSFKAGFWQILSTKFQISFLRLSYIFPWYKRTRHISNQETAKGTITIAAIVLLLNSCCYRADAGILRTSLVNTSLIALLIPTIAIISLVQLFYVIPQCKKLKQEKHHHKLKGVIIGAIVTFLLNAVCCGLVLWILIN